MEPLSFEKLRTIYETDESSVDAVKLALGKTLTSVVFTEHALDLGFSDGSGLRIWDGGQDCCESRYMTCDGDDLSYWAGATLQSVDITDVEPTDAAGEVHEIRFLHITTSKGAFTIANHNEHNGYYGGFLLKAQITSAGEPTK